MSRTAVDNAFKELSRDVFRFLVTDYGFADIGIIKRDQQYPLDQRISRRFVRQGIGVEVTLGISGLSVALVDANEGVFPDHISFVDDKKGCPAVALNSLVAFRVKHSKVGVLSDATNRMLNTIRATRLDYTPMTNVKMERTLRVYADVLKEYAYDILKGDTAIFRNVQAFYSGSLGRVGKEAPN